MNIICKTCRGSGQTKETRTIVKFVKGRPKTTQIGSGCPVCLGTGIKGERK